MGRVPTQNIYGREPPKTGLVILRLYIRESTAQGFGFGVYWAFDWGVGFEA